jgi:4-amino-4-deoxy-L-arabinose transferase-like glycosyltransferase
LTIGLLLRLYKLNIPLADLHSWRQADTASVARNFVKNGFDLLHPKYDDLSNVQSGIDNPQGFRMVEFPIYNALIAASYKAFPTMPLERWGRLISIVFSLVTILVIYLILLKEKGRISAFFAGLIYAVFPFFVYFSRIVLPEPMALGFVALSVFFLYQGDTKHVARYTLYVILSLIFFSLSLLIKPTTIFFALPLIYIMVRNHRLRILKNPLFYIYFLLAILPIFIWRNYIRLFPEGIPVNEWLITSVNTGGSLQRIYFRPSFFRWIFFERINNLILGGYLSVFMLLGIMIKQKGFFLHSFLLASLAYLFVFQGGNVQHEYYQILILPSLAIFTALGIDFLFQKKNTSLFSYAFLALPLLLIFSWYFSYVKVKDYYQYSQELIQEAKVLNDLTKPGDKIVTDRIGDTTLLYLADRKGAPSIFKEPYELSKLGYKYLITSNKDQIGRMLSEYKIVFENEKFTLFAL